jgi:hypothetical protein
MHLEHRQLGGLQRIEDGDRGVRKGAGVDHDACGLLARLLDPGDQLALVVRLAKVDRKPERAGPRLAPAANVGERLVAVDGGLTGAEQVEVGSVQDVDRLGHGRAGEPDGAGLDRMTRRERGRGDS